MPNKPKRHDASQQQQLSRLSRLQYEREPGRTADKAFYNSKAWKEFRDWFLSRHPLCAHCEQHGRITEARHVHHVKERKRHPDLTFSEANCEGLCVPCHSREECTRRGQKNRAMA